MSLFIQHGYGKSNKIHEAVEDGTVQGVVLAPRSERPQKLAICVDELRALGCEVLVDPQFYVFTLSPPNDQHLSEYPYYRTGLTATSLTGGRRVATHVREVLEFEAQHNVSAIVSPTVIVDSFTDRWYQIALEFADASLQQHARMSSPPPLMLSFAFAEEALSSLEDVNRFLDTVTQDGWDMAGFYLVVVRNEKSYSQRFEATRMANFMYMIHSLSRVNDFRVICGYSDFCGVPFRAVGADAFATGWAQTARQFHRGTFIQRPAGGQPPRERYSSGPLCNSIFLNELQDIFDVGYLPNVLSGVPLDSVITSAASPDAAGWTNNMSQRHHWQTLHQLEQRFTGRLRSDVVLLLQYLRACQGMYRFLEGVGVQFETNTNGDHLADWIRATRDFSREAGIALP